MRYFSSDFHFGHRNVITYCNRPFKDVDEMNVALVKIWNETVKEDDEVYILGDFSLNPNRAFEFVNQLNGTKYLITGNHDACFPAHKKYAKFIKKYEENGFKEASSFKIITLGHKYSVLMSHMPYANAAALQYDKRYLSYRPIDEGSILLHGHLHGRYKKNGRMIDVGIDAHDMKILSENDIVELIENKESFIPSSLTEFYKNRVDDRNNMKGM